MQKPFFSIVVVSLNPGERLKITLESILKQTYTDYEVILKDGGSTDGSLQGLIEIGYFENNGALAKSPDNLVNIAINITILLTENRTSKLNILHCTYKLWNHCHKFINRGNKYTKHPR